MTTTSTSGSAGENDSTLAVRDMARGSKNRTIAGAIKALFRTAAKALTSSEDEPTPAAKRRRSGETEGEPHVPAADHASAVLTMPAARGRYTALSKAEKATDAVVPDAAYVNAAVYLSDTLEWLQLWENNTTASQWLDDDFNAKQPDRYFPQL